MSFKSAILRLEFLPLPKSFRMMKRELLAVLALATLGGCQTEPIVHIELLSLEASPSRFIQDRFELSWTAEYDPERTIGYYDLDLFLSKDDSLSAEDAWLGRVPCAPPDGLFLYDRAGTVDMARQGTRLSMDIDRDGVFDTPVDVGELWGNRHLIAKATTTTRPEYDTVSHQMVLPISFE